MALANHAPGVLHIEGVTNTRQEPQDTPTMLFSV